MPKENGHNQECGCPSCVREAENQPTQERSSDNPNDNTSAAATVRRARGRD